MSKAKTIRGRVVGVTQNRARIAWDIDESADVPRGSLQVGDLATLDRDHVVRVHGATEEVGEWTRLDVARRRHIRDRGRILASIREFFAERDFLEVETPLLVKSPGLEVHLEAVAAGAGWLITSPEYHMKRLLVAGLERIYTMCKCFRAEEHGPQHSTEFTMLEWYRGWATLDEIHADTEALVAAVATSVNGEAVVTAPDGRRLSVAPPWPRMSVADAMKRYAGVEVRGTETAEQLRVKVRAAGIEIGSAREWDDVFFCAFVDAVEPALRGLDHPIFLTHWPRPLAALAKQCDDNPAVVERFEAYVGGVELANAFGELTDATEQRARFTEELAERRRRGKPEYPLDQQFLGALEQGMPPSAGIALGVDRLVMLVCGAGHIGEVQTFAAGEV